MPSLRHVRRDSLPWQPYSPKTECGRTITDKHRIISRGEWYDLFREDREDQLAWRRAGVNARPSRLRPDVCAVCWETCLRWRSWFQDPLQATKRVLENAESWVITPESIRIRAELLALAELVAYDPDRFAQLTKNFEYHLRERSR